MELQQLGNLVEYSTGSREYGDWRGDQRVMVMDAEGDLRPVLSLSWSAGHQCFVICVDDVQDDEGPKDLS